jgi:hypothetical protein
VGKEQGNDRQSARDRNKPNRNFKRKKINSGYAAEYESQGKPQNSPHTDAPLFLKRTLRSPQRSFVN